MAALYETALSETGSMDRGQLDFLREKPFGFRRRIEMYGRSFSEGVSTLSTLLAVTLDPFVNLAKRIIQDISSQGRSVTSSKNHKHRVLLLEATASALKFILVGENIVTGTGSFVASILIISDADKHTEFIRGLVKARALQVPLH